MPAREAHLARWQVATIWVLFLALAVAYVVGLLRLHQQQSEIVAARNSQIAAVRANLRAACVSRHLLVFVNLVALRDSETQTRLALRGQAGRVPGLRRLFEHALIEDRKLLRLARRADCKLPPSPPVPPSPPSP